MAVSLQLHRPVCSFPLYLLQAMVKVVKPWRRRKRETRSHINTRRADESFKTANERACEASEDKQCERRCSVLSIP